MPTVNTDMRLVSVVMLDSWNLSMTVRELRTERRWFRSVVVEQVKSYDLAIRVGRWLDGSSYVLKPDPRHFKLWELFAAWRFEQKFNQTIGIPKDMPLLDS